MEKAIEEQKEILIRGRAKESGTPRPELGALTQGAEYLIPEALFDEVIFDRVPEEIAPDEAVGDVVTTKKKEGGVK